MELMLKDINVCECNKIINTNCSAEADIIVPDTKPDIYKILCVNAMADLTEKYIRKGKMVFSGNVNFNIMYVGDNSKSTIYTIDYSVPFNHQTDIGDNFEDCTCIARCHVSSTDFKLKNSRKLTAKSNLAITGQAMKHSFIKALEKIEGEDCAPFRQSLIKSDSMVNSKEFKFNVSDTLSLPGRESVSEIYDFSAGINISEIKQVNNKAIIKGSLPAKIFYVSGTSPAIYETEFSFTEIADLDMMSSESILSSYFSVAGVNYEVTDNDGDVTIDADILVRSFIKAYEPVEYFVTSDIYSPDYKYTINKSKSNLEKYTHLSPVQITVKDIIGSNSDDGDIAKVHYMNIYPVCEKVEYDNSNVLVSGSIKASVIYSNHDDELCSIHRIIPYNAEVPANESLKDSFFDVIISTVNYGYVLSSDKDIQVRCVLRFEVDAYTKCNTSLITDFTLDKNSPINKSSQPSITVCYPDAGMSLWDYAVKYNTTCEEIASVNNIDVSSELSSESPILIPKRQIK